MNNPWDVCPKVASFKSYEPGLSMEEIKEKYGLDKVLKFASNENPFGVSPKVLQRLTEVATQSFRYPQSGNPRLVEKITNYYQKKYPHLTSKQVFVSNGSDEIIDLLFRVKTEPGKHNVVAFKPCFGLYEIQAKFQGCEFRQAPLNDDFSFNFESLLKLVDQNTSMVFVTAPDNPSGLLAKKSELANLAKSLPAQCLLIIDEAYIEFAGDENKTSLLGDLDKYENIVIMRTFSKVYGLAGLRIGYAFLPEKLANYLWRVRLPFSLNILANEAAIAALDDEEFKQKTIKNNEIERFKMFNSLEELGCKVTPSSANFLMFRLPESYNPKEFNQQLLERGIIVRYLASYDLPNYLRFSIGTKEDNQIFIDTLKILMSIS